VTRDSHITTTTTTPTTTTIILDKAVSTNNFKNENLKEALNS
jgi:hypothetical protein